VENAIGGTQKQRQRRNLDVQHPGSAKTPEDLGGENYASTNEKPSNDRS
jgi:hypothetical protein